MLAQETRITLEGAPTVLCSELPGPQVACEGWHCVLPASSVHRLPPSDQLTFGELCQAAGDRHKAAADEVLMFTPRPMAIGVVCACGRGSERAVGIVGRVRCPACGGDTVVPLSVAHEIPLAEAPGKQRLACAGLPPGDMIWTFTPDLPSSDWIPWVFEPARARPGKRPRIGIIGVGALGYPTAEVLLRRGYALDLVDFDSVEAKNLGVSYTASAVGKPKVVAARKILRSVIRGADVRAWPGDVSKDIGLGIMAEWEAAVLCLDRVSAKVVASGYLTLVGKPYLQAQIDGATATALVRTYIPGRSACVQCLLEPDELEYDAAFSCRAEQPGRQGDHPQLFTTPVEAHIGAALVAWQLAQIVPPPGLSAISSRIRQGKRGAFRCCRGLTA